MKLTIWTTFFLVMAVSGTLQEMFTIEDAIKWPENLIEALNQKYSNPSSRIVNGIRVRPGERPFQIALHRRGRFICGGSLIGKRWALTAAHCVAQTSADQFAVHYGTLRHSTGPSVSVQRIWSHPGYNEASVRDDIALLRLSAPVNETQGKVGFAQINRSRGDLTKDEPVTVSGWGRTSRNQSVSEELQKANLKIVDYEECRKRWGGVFQVGRGMVCAGDEFSSACHGDSGGPLTLKSGETLLQIGVVSVGSPTCYSDKLPNVYTNVYYYRDWIRRIMRWN